MATYNGQLFVKEQILSILNQLSSRDELVISDDGSNDETLSIVSEISDPRIKIFKNKNIGHVGNFQRAIKFADGDFIFLSDQDDIWESQKIKKIMYIFNSFPDVSLIQHSFVKVDSDGIPLEIKKNSKKSIKLVRVVFFLKQFFKPDFYGCASAFRSSLKESLIPFPRCVYAHDHWILIAALLQGGVYYLDDALIFYRQHDANLTPKNGLTLPKKIYNRCLFIFLFFITLRRHFFKTSAKPINNIDSIN
jgi:glycosyltransferase involved in cell wall biosynthesis